MSQGLGIHIQRRRSGLAGVTMRGKEANDTDFPTDNSRPSERADANVAADRHAAQISCLLHVSVFFLEVETAIACQILNLFTNHASRINLFLTYSLPDLSLAPFVGQSCLHMTDQ